MRRLSLVMCVVLAACSRPAPPSRSSAAEPVATESVASGHMEMMSKRIPHARYLYCPNGCHLAMYDDQKTYMDGVVGFIEDVNAGRF